MWPLTLEVPAQLAPEEGPRDARTRLLRVFRGVRASCVLGCEEGGAAFLLICARGWQRRSAALRFPGWLA